MPLLYILLSRAAIGSISTATMEATLEKEFVDGEAGPEEPTLAEKVIRSVASSLAGFVHDPRHGAERLPDALLGNTGGSSPPRCGGSNKQGRELGVEDKVVVIGGGGGEEEAAAEDVQVLGERGEGEGEVDGSGMKGCVVDGASGGVEDEAEKRRECEEKLRIGGDEDCKKEKKLILVEDI